MHERGEKGHPMCSQCVRKRKPQSIDAGKTQLTGSQTERLEREMSGVIPKTLAVSG
jgi:hypothetical protein